MLFSSANPEDHTPSENSPAKPEGSILHASSQPTPALSRQIFNSYDFPHLDRVNVLSETQSVSEGGFPEVTLHLQRGPYTADVTVHHEQLDVLKNPNVHPILYIPGLSDALFNPFAEHASDETAFCYVSVEINKKLGPNAIHIPSLMDAMATADVALDWLCNVHQNKVVLAGFSLGGLVAAKLASSCEEQVSAVALFSPTFLPPTKSWVQANILMPVFKLAQDIKDYFKPASTNFYSTDTYSTLRESLKTSDHSKVFSGIKAPIQISMNKSEGFSRRYYEFLLSFCNPEQRQLDVFAGKHHSPDDPWKIVAALDFIEQFYPPKEAET